MSDDMERINGVAIRHEGVVYVKEAPFRHHDVIHMMAEEHGLDAGAMHDQGFTTTRGRFVNRKLGRFIAEAAGQRIRTTGPADMLFSEDLW